MDHVDELDRAGEFWASGLDQARRDKPGRSLHCQINAARSLEAQSGD
jgi:hypothetical protein